MIKVRLKDNTVKYSGEVFSGEERSLAPCRVSGLGVDMSDKCSELRSDP